MDWETSRIGFVAGIVVCAAVGALASGYKTINGEGFLWRKMLYRWLYRAVIGTSAGLIISTLTTEIRILWAAVLVISVSGIGEDALLEWLPFNVERRPSHDKKNDRATD